MASFSFSVDSVSVTPRGYNCVYVDVDIAASDLLDLVTDMTDSLSNADKQDLFDKLKDEGYGND